MWHEEAALRLPEGQAAADTEPYGEATALEPGRLRRISREFAVNELHRVALVSSVVTAGATRRYDVLVCSSIPIFETSP